MKITRAYIDEPKPIECRKCYFYAPQVNLSDACDLGAIDYAHCPLVYAPSKSMQRRLDVQLDDKGEE